MLKNHLLIDKFLNHTISPNERAVLEKWVLESEQNKAYFKSYISNQNLEIFQDFDWETAYNKFLIKKQSKKKNSKVILKSFKYAALILILISIGFFTKNKFKEVSTRTSNEVVTSDLGGVDNIVIKLADGSSKIINKNGSEIITDDKKNYVAKKIDNVLSFGINDTTSTDSELLTEVYVPHGETFSIQLSDGTMVFLNSGSKLKFPQHFTQINENRLVYLEGEAYFNVSKNESKPFIVNTKNINVKVYGTQFNVSSYESDMFIETTLVEGSVSVSESGLWENQIFIKPNFQAQYNKVENNFTKKEVDTQIYTAWMQNRFVINNLTFSQILTKLERMYNVNFENEATQLNKETFKGEFKDENIQSVLTTMALSIPFNFEINGKVIKITN
tara:strand:- start:9381 stop:10544 length:1164 start_codon:yes stop_codon:yes gene_type:complete